MFLTIKTASMLATGDRALRRVVVSRNITLCFVPDTL